MSRLNIVSLLLLALLSGSAFGQEKGIVKNDTINVRLFHTKELKEYKADKDFNYGELREDFSPSLWDRFWAWFWSLFRDSISNAQSGGIFKYIFIALGCAALIFLLVKFAGMESGYLFTRKSKEIEIPYQENLENIHEISFNDAINNALENKDFRLAVRLLYLQSLKQLSNSGKIKWEPDKTNSTYINELKNPELKNEFKSLTHRFEYVWYGSFPIEKDVYIKISDSFTKFYTTV